MGIVVFLITGHAGFISSTVRKLVRVATAPELGFLDGAAVYCRDESTAFLKGFEPYLDPK